MKNVRVITLITNAKIGLLKPEYLRVVFNTRMDSIPLNGEKVTFDIKYSIDSKEHHYFVRVYDIAFKNIEDLIQDFLHYTKNADRDVKYKKIFIRFSNPK
jgi:hypothetical protein